MEDEVTEEHIPITFDLSVEQFRDLFVDAGPPTEDDVPFRFAHPTPLKPAPTE